MPSNFKAFQAAAAAPMIVPSPGSPAGAPATLLKGLPPTQTDVDGEMGARRFDVIDRLPARAAAKLEALRDEASVAHGVVLSISDQRAEAEHLVPSAD